MFLIAARAERALSEAESTALDSHLETCELCAEVATDESPEPESLAAGSNGDSVRAETLDAHAGSSATRAAALAPPDGELLDLPTVDPDVYHWDKQLARGGMGRVFRARDRRLGRAVAIKEILSRTHQQLFEAEARLTARLQHPAIVNIHEAGRWPSGEPFYAMSLVEGQSLEQAIEAAADFEDRVELLSHVMDAIDAIAYAHSQRVVHRDIKPQNIMVGQFGETVILDWGLAKDLSSTAAEEPTTPYRSNLERLTVAGMGTPSYMPCEQAEGRATDERMDVYALGATLYHVLAGKPPYGKRPALEVLEKLRAGPPAPLDDETAPIPHELEAIVAKAMARDAEARYATAGELAADLRRFRTGQLVTAHAYSLRALLARWIARHRSAVAAAVAVVVVLAVAGGLSVWRIASARNRAELQQQIAERQTEIAQQNQADVESLLGFMLGDLREKLTPIGKLELLDLVASKALDYYAEHPAQSESPEMTNRRALAHESLGVVFDERGDANAAREQYRTAIEYHERALSENPEALEWQDQLAQSHVRLAQRLPSNEGLPHWNAALVICERLVEEDPGNLRWRGELAQFHVLLGNDYRGRNRDKALEHYQAAIGIARGAPELAPNGGPPLMAWATVEMGKLYKGIGDIPRAIELYQEAVELAGEFFAANPTDAETQHTLCSAYLKLAELHQMKGDKKAATEHARTAVELAGKLTQRDPSNTRWQQTFAEANRLLSLSLVPVGDWVVVLQIAGRDPKNPGERATRAMAERFLGITEQDWEESFALFRVAQEIYARLLRTAPKTPSWRWGFGCTQWGLGMSLEARGRLDEALERYEAAAAVFEPLHSWWELLQVIEGQGRVLRRQKKFASALDQFRNYLAISQQRAKQDPDNANWPERQARGHYDIGVTLKMFGRKAEAKKELVAGAEIWAAQGWNPSHRYDAACCYALAGMADPAFESLELALDRGFNRVDWIEKDHDLTSLHSDPRWKALIEKAHSK